MLPKSINIFLAMALGMVLIGCSGAGLGPSEGGAAALTPDQWASLSHGGAQPSDGLPAFPDESSLGRSASAIGGNPVMGSEYLLMANCVVEGSALRINGGSGGDPALGDGGGFGNSDFGWAMYGIGGLGGKRALSLNVECLPGALGEAYYVGVADFTNLNWEWSGPIGIPECQFDLSGSNARYVSALGNLYFVIVCWADNSALHSRSTVVLGDGNGSLPGAPRNLEASKGVFPDGVMLTWDPGAGAEAYEVQRASQYWSQGDPGGGDGGNGGGGGVPGGDGWVTIGQTPDTSYFDQTIPPNEICDYRLRAVNGAGVSGWSNEDYGYAGDGQPPFGDYALQGTIYASDDATNSIVPLPGVTVSVQKADGTVAATAQTDDSGYYFLPDLPGGAYIAVAGLEGWSFDPEYAYFELTPDCPSAWIDFFAYQGGGGGGDPGTEMGVYGNVYSVDESDPNGNLTPIPGATVTVMGVGALVAEATTDEQGFYQFLDLGPGVYTIKAEKDGYYFEDSYTFQWGENVPDIRLDFYGRLAP